MINYKLLLKKYGITPQKSKGQNFLIDESIVETIIRESNISKKDRILEIGPGLGILTERLLETAGKVLTVELDEQLAVIIADRFKNYANFELLRDDILKVKNGEIRERLGGDYRVIANIPYVITSAIIRKFLSYEPKPLDMFLMAQKEVAERIVAEPGKMSVLAVSVQFYAQAKMITVIPKKSFYPEPEVDSAILRLQLKAPTPLSPSSGGGEGAGLDEKKFFWLVKIGFSARRKKLYNNLAAGLQKSVGEIKLILDKSEISIDVRAQDLSVDDWVRLRKHV